jgi:hypothetical protein
LNIPIDYSNFKDKYDKYDAIKSKGIIDKELIAKTLTNTTNWFNNIFNWIKDTILAIGVIIGSIIAITLVTFCCIYMGKPCLGIIKKALTRNGRGTDRAQASIGYSITQDGETDPLSKAVTINLNDTTNIQELAVVAENNTIETQLQSTNTYIYTPTVKKMELIQLRTLSKLNTNLKK